jgi:inorganic pyrophosphatase
MSLLQLGPGPDAPIVVQAVVEIPKGSSNKYEFSPGLGVFMLDRVLYSPLFYPCDYGWIPGTLALDGDPVDILIMLTHPTFPGCVVPARPVGALQMEDEQGPDMKILAACGGDPRFDEIHQLEDVPAPVCREIVHFFQSYKQLEGKPVEVLGWEGREAAYGYIEECIRRAGGGEVNEEVED